MTATFPTTPKGPGRMVTVTNADGEAIKVGAAMVDVLTALVRLGRVANSRNALRLAVTGNQGQGRIYRAIDACEAAGLVELVAPLPTRPSYPRVQITPLGAAAIVAWLEGDTP